jgi:hypothetical protein
MYVRTFLAVGEMVVSETRRFREIAVSGGRWKLSAETLGILLSQAKNMAGSVS